MSNWLKYTLIILGLGCLVIQFLGPDRPEVSKENPEDLMKVAVIDQEVANLIQAACYDCHSFETSYPWYANFAPIKWSIYDHIIQGREELNFSEWGNMEKRRKIRKLKEIAEEVEEHKMPMDDYVMLHPDADLTAEQRVLLISWSKEMSRAVLTQ